MSCKFAFKWLGPYRITNIIKDKSMYMLKKLDRLQLVGTFIGNKFKKFYLRQQLQLDYAPNLEHKEIPTLNNFLAGNDNSDFSNTPDNF